MSADEHVGERPITGESPQVPAGEPERWTRRPGGRDGEPLFVELAWLVIEAAVVFRRLRGILARL